MIWLISFVTALNPSRTYKQRPEKYNMEYTEVKPAKQGPFQLDYIESDGNNIVIKLDMYGVVFLSIVTVILLVTIICTTVIIFNSCAINNNKKQKYHGAIYSDTESTDV